jgi:N-methylhydantoinase A
MKIDRELARKAIQEKISLKTGLSVEEAALGIVKMVNAEMSKILRIVSVERGHDPREFALFAFGGAGPIHACPLAEELNIEKIVVPQNPGLFSALGLLAADFTHQTQQPVMKRIQDISATSIEEKFRELEENEKTVLSDPRLLAGENVIERQVDARYVGQSYEISLDVRGNVDENMITNLAKKFHERHQLLYGHYSETEPIEIVNLRVVARRGSANPSLTYETSGNGKLEPSSMRNVFFEDYSDFLGCPVFNREQLGIDADISGPAIIEQYDATTVVYPKWDVKMDAVGSLFLIRRGL